jgi:O-antigen ligase
MANPYEGLANPSRPSGLFTPLVGEYGRYEGFLSLMAYAGIFLMGMCITEKKTINRIFNVIIAMGIFESVWAILQHIPGLGFPNMYKDLPTLSYDNVYLASGTTDSPIFFGAFLTLASSVAALSSMFAQTQKRRFVCGGAAALMFTVGLFTSSITPIVGFIAISVIGTIWAIINYKRVKDKTPIAVIGILIAVFAVIFVIVLLTQGLWIRDTFIARFDEFYRKLIMGSTVSDDRSMYSVAWNKSLAMIREFPIFGVGPDCFAAFQNFATMSYDKSYNEFLFIAATRGIPALIGYIALIVLFVIRMKKQSDKYANPMTYIIFTAATAYLVQSFVNASAITVAPIFWLLLGIGFADIKFDEKGKKK